MVEHAPKGKALKAGKDNALNVRTEEVAEVRTLKQVREQQELGTHDIFYSFLLLMSSEFWVLRKRNLNLQLVL